MKLDIISKRVKKNQLDAQLILSIFRHPVHVSGVSRPIIRRYNRMYTTLGRAETECDGARKRTGGEVKGKKVNGGGSQQSCTVSDTVYPALLPLMRTPRLPAAD